jgi:hypothetical protein
MISKKDLIARAKARENINNNIPNPYNLNRKQDRIGRHLLLSVNRKSKQSESNFDWSNWR